MNNSVEEFLCQELQKICNPFSNSCKSIQEYDPWGMLNPLNIKILKDFIFNKIEAKKPEGCGFLLPEIEKAYHYARIAYFVNNGWDDEILLKFGIVPNDYWPGWTIINGNHRYCAALFMNRETILGKVIIIEKDFDYTKFLKKI